MSSKTSNSKHSSITSRSPSTRTSNHSTDLSPVDIDYWSRSFLALVYPVSLTVVISAILSSFLYDLYGQTNIFTENSRVLRLEENETNSVGKVAWQSFAMALIAVFILALFTCFLVLIVHCGCMKFLYIYLAITVVLIFSLLNLSILSMIIAQLNVPIDWITISLYVFNVLIAAMLSMFWYAPDCVKQSVTIYQCIIMVLYVLKIVPEWVAWVMLPLLAIWDMLAVLLPFGPLYLLIKIFEKRKVTVPPMMIYTTGLWFDEQTVNVNPTDNQKAASSGHQLSSMNLIFISKSSLNYLFDVTKSSILTKNDNSPTNAKQNEKRKTRKSMLGLGDFIFYSILLSKTVFSSNCNVFLIIIVYLSIIMGMFGTTMILVILHRPLPALPISLFVGLIVFFYYQYIGEKFAVALHLPSGPVII